MVDSWIFSIGRKIAVARPRFQASKMVKMGAEKLYFPEKSVKFLVFVLFEFVADSDRAKRVRDRSGGKS